MGPPPQLTAAAGRHRSPEVEPDSGWVSPQHPLEDSRHPVLAARESGGALRAFPLQPWLSGSFIPCSHHLGAGHTKGVKVSIASFFNWVCAGQYSPRAYGVFLGCAV